MSYSYLGSLTLGQCVPTALSAQGALDASIGVSLPEIQAKITGMLALQASLTITPPSIVASLEAALDMLVELQASLALTMPELSVTLGLQITALFGTVTSIGLTLPDIAAKIYAALAMVASLKGALMASLLPSASLNLTMIASILAELNLALGALNANLAISVSLAALLGTPGIHAYQVGGVGSELPVAPPGVGPTDAVTGVLLVASDGGASAALRTMFGLST